MPQLACGSARSRHLPKHVSLPFSGAGPVDGGPPCLAPLPVSLLAFSALLCVHESSVLASTPHILAQEVRVLFHSVTLPVTMSQSPATRNSAWHLEVLGKYWSSEA